MFSARNALIFGGVGLFLASFSQIETAEAAFRCPSGQIYRVTKKVCVPKSEALQFLSRARPKAKPREQAKAVVSEPEEKPVKAQKPAKSVKPVEAEAAAAMPVPEPAKPVAPAVVPKPAQAYVPEAKPQSAITAPPVARPQSAITAPPPSKPAPFGQLVPVKPTDD